MNKLYINNNKYIYRIFGYCLAAISIFQVAKATVLERNNFEYIDINPWSFTELLINYEGGFVRRGFVGNLIFQLDSDGILFDTLYFFVFINFIIFVALIFLNLRTSSLSNFQKLLFHISIFAPFNITLFGNFYSRKEMFLINFYLLSLLIFRNKRKNIFLYSCFLFGTLALLIHEGVALFILFPFYIFLLKKKNIEQSVIYLFSFSMFSLFILLILFKGNTQIVSDIWSSLSSEDIVLINNLDPNAITSIGWGVLDTLKTTYIAVFSGSIIYWSVFFVMIGYTISIILNEHINEIYIILKNSILNNKEFLIIIPLFFFTFDYGRWIFTIFYLTFFTLIMFKENTINKLKFTYNLAFYVVISLLTAMPPCCIAMESTQVSSNYYRIYKSIEITIIQLLK
jgi:hypothetical protein